MKVPADLMYTKSHEWVRLEGDIATVGITDYAQSELGDIVYVDLPEPGRALQKGQVFGTVESVKTVSDLYAPVAGQVVDKNPELEGRSELMNQDPYDAGWVIKIKIEGEPTDLLSATEYEALLSE